MLSWSKDTLSPLQFFIMMPWLIYVANVILGIGAAVIWTAQVIQRFQQQSGLQKNLDIFTFTFTFYRAMYLPTTPIQQLSHATLASFGRWTCLLTSLGTLLPSYSSKWDLNKTINITSLSLFQQRDIISKSAHIVFVITLQRNWINLASFCFRMRT